MKRRPLEHLPEDFGELLLSCRQHHGIWIRVIDKVEPKMTRWRVQLPLQSNCVIGWYGLEGFTDEAAVARTWHYFEIKRRARVRAFLRAIAPLLRQGLIEVEIDGRKVAIASVVPARRSSASNHTTRRTIAPAARIVRKARA